ncbi:MAG: transposase family protein [Spirosomataceae bacterium]
MRLRKKIIAVKKTRTLKNAVICTKEQYICYVSPTYEGKKHDKALADKEDLLFSKPTIMMVDLGYMGYKTPNLTVLLPHKKPYKAELSEVQKSENTQHAKERVCNEHTMKGIKRLRVVKETLRLCSYQWTDSLFENACGWYNLRVKSPLRAYTHQLAREKTKI